MSTNPAWDHGLREFEAAFTEASKQCDTLFGLFEEANRKMSGCKLAFSTLNARKEELAQLRSELVEGTTPTNQDIDQSRYAVCVIDGNELRFSADHLKAGKFGGRTAATTLNHSLNQRLYVSAHPHTTVYLDRAGLSDRLINDGTLFHPSQLDEFIAGFNQASSHSTIVDAGAGKEGTESKVEDAIRMFTSIHQVEKVFFGGVDNNSYSSLIQSLVKPLLSGKLTLIGGKGAGAKLVGSNGLEIPDLFLETQDVSGEAHGEAEQEDTSTPAFVPAMSSTTSDLDPLSARKYAEDGVTNRHVRALVPGPIRAQVPLPCHSYYLLRRGCANGDKCQFAHDYRMTQEDINCLRQETAAVPCKMFYEKGKCYLDECLYSHSAAPPVIQTSIIAPQGPTQHLPYPWSSYASVVSAAAPAASTSQTPPPIATSQTTVPKSAFQPLLSILHKAKTEDRLPLEGVNVVSVIGREGSILYRKAGVLKYKEYIQAAIDRGYIEVVPGLTGVSDPGALFSLGKPKAK